jgi:hypothetical protein
MIRTCDQRFRKPLLYPLSYEGDAFILALVGSQANGRVVHLVSVRLDASKLERTAEKLPPGQRVRGSRRCKLF